MTSYPSTCGGYGVPGPPGEPGLPGEDGTVLNTWRGVWSLDGTYSPGDLVHYRGSVYILNVPPSVPTALFASNSYYAVYPEPPAAPWELFVAGTETDEPGS